MICFWGKTSKILERRHFYTNFWLFDDEKLKKLIIVEMVHKITCSPLMCPYQARLRLVRRVTYLHKCNEIYSNQKYCACCIYRVIHSSRIVFAAYPSNKESTVCSLLQVPTYLPLLVGKVRSSGRGVITVKGAMCV